MTMRRPSETRETVGPSFLSRYPVGLQVAGQAVSSFGDAFSNVAMPLLVLALTGSVAQMGVVVAISALSQLVGSLIAGHVVDTVDRRRLLIGCDIAQLALGGLVPALWWVMPAEVWSNYAILPIYVIVACSAALLPVYEVAMRAILPQIVSRDRMVRANSLLTTCNEVAYGVGPAVAGFAIALVGEPGAIGVNALTYGFAAITWYLIRPMLRPGAHHGAEPDNRSGEPTDQRPDVPTQRNPWVGLRFLLDHPTLRLLTILELATSVLTTAALTLFIYYLSHDLAAGSGAVGVMLSLGSIGAVLAAVAAGWLGNRFGVGPMVILGILVQSAVLLVAPLQNSVVGIGVLSVIFGFGQILCLILILTTRQMLTPDGLLGRVTAAALTLKLIVVSVAGIASTSLAQATSARAVFTLLGILGLAVAVGAVCTREGRAGPTRDDAAPVDTTGGTTDLGEHG